VAEHLTSEEARKYTRGEASPGTLLGWDDHLAECADCRGKLSAGRSLPEWAASLSSENDAVHLTQEQLVARAGNRVPDTDRFAVESHLKECSACQEEWAELAQFRRGLTTKPAPYRWVWAAAAAAAVVIGVLALRNPSGPSPLSLPGTWSAQDRLLVQQTVQAGALRFAPLPSDLTRKSGTLLGASTPNVFAPVGPLGKIVESDRPPFEWQELAEATSYHAEVFDADFNLVMQSPALTATKWTPAQALPRGKLYHWQITATKRGEAITVPSPPAAEADFRVLDQPTEERIEQARAAGGMGHLLAATLFAQAGMQAEAQEELNKLPEEARRDPQIAKLVADAASQSH
jgi:hypothetical protein